MATKLFKPRHLDEGEQGYALREQKQSDSSWSRFYYRPITQVVLLGCICFACPGLFNALSSLGGGGQVSTKVASNSLTALYSTFAVASFFSGTFVNVMGVKKSLFIGSLGYSLYVASLLTYNIKRDQVSAFVITSGAILGLSASLLWTSQSTLMLSLPAESEKGKFISIFWMIFNAGDVIGSAILLGESGENNTAASVSTGGYSVFVGLTALGTLLAFGLVPPQKITRSDGTRVVPPTHPSWRRELLGLIQTLKRDPYLFLCFPFFAVSNIFYVYHFNALNAGLFSLRSRAASSNPRCANYWEVLDSSRFSRRTRALSGWIIVFVLIQIVWSCSYLVQKTFTRENSRTLDFGDSTGRSYYASVTILYIFCGFTDSAWQIVAFYLIGSLSNSPRKLAFISGFYKAFQSALNAVFWHLDASRIPYMKLLIITWSCLSAALVIVLPMFLFRVRNFTTTEIRLVETEAELDTETYTTIDDNRSLRSINGNGYNNSIHRQISSDEENDLNDLYRRKSKVDKLPTLTEDFENQGSNLNTIDVVNDDSIVERDEEVGNLLEMKELIPDVVREKCIKDEEEKY